MHSHMLDALSELHLSQILVVSMTVILTTRSYTDNQQFSSVSLTFPSALEQLTLLFLFLVGGSLHPCAFISLACEL